MNAAQLGTIKEESTLACKKPGDSDIWKDEVTNSHLTLFEKGLYELWLKRIAFGVATCITESAID